jgi:hypothetical protein
MQNPGQLPRVTAGVSLVGLEIVDLRDYQEYPYTKLLESDQKNRVNGYFPAEVFGVNID